MTELQFMDVPNFALQRGGMLPLARLAYRTIGKLSAQKDNAVLIPSWITGNDTESEAVMCSPDRALNPDKLFIILTNHLGAGRSSSPSNTPAPCERARFPTVTYYDNIALQQKLVSDTAVRDDDHALLRRSASLMALIHTSLSLRLRRRIDCCLCLDCVPAGT